MMPRMHNAELIDHENIIEKIRNFDNGNTTKKRHIKSKSVYNPNPFVKYEYTHPGKFIKFEHEKNDAWSCCLSDDKNAKVRMINLINYTNFLI